MKARSWPWLLAALLAWYEARQERAEKERNQEAHYDLAKYRPRPRALDRRRRK